MSGKVNAAVPALDNLVKMIDRLGNAADAAVSAKDDSLKYILAKLSGRIFEIDASTRKWIKIYEEALKHLYDEDDEGHKSINPEYLRMKVDAEKKIEQCKTLKKATSMHIEILENKAQNIVLDKYNTDCSNIQSYVSQLRQHIQTYNSSDGFSSFAMGWSGSATQTNSSEKKMALAQNSSLTENEFEGQRVLQRDIDWNYIPRDVGEERKGLTNRERAMGGLSPYDKEGGKIQLDHFGQEYDGTLTEIPSLYHISEQYNVHEGNSVSNSFRNDPTLNKEYESFRRRYWIDRSKY